MDVQSATGECVYVCVCVCFKADKLTDWKKRTTEGRQKEEERTRSTGESWDREDERERENSEGTNQLRRKLLWKHHVASSEVLLCVTLSCASIHSHPILSVCVCFPPHLTSRRPAVVFGPNSGDLYNTPCSRCVGRLLSVNENRMETPESLKQSVKKQVSPTASESYKLRHAWI